MADDNPRRDWGLSSYPTQPNRDTVRTPADEKDGVAGRLLKRAVKAIAGRLSR